MRRHTPPKKDKKKAMLIIAIGSFIMIAGHFLAWNMYGTFPKFPKVGPVPQDIGAVEVSVPANIMYVPVEELQKEGFEPGEALQEAEQALQDRSSANGYNTISLVRGFLERSSMRMSRLLQGKRQSAGDSDDTPVVYEEPIAEEAHLAEMDALDDVPAPVLQIGQKPRIVVIIDDMGVSRSLSREVVELPEGLTLAYLPYAHDLQKQTLQARAKGHELMIHMPMEPLDPHIDTGPHAIKDGMNPAQVWDALQFAFRSFDGYVGLNNHMGSRVTQNTPIMREVMNILAQKKLFFIDSKTIQASVASKEARRKGLPYAERDIFLDHVETPEFVRDSLEKLEAVARRKGVAIAIGHPKRVTIDALRAWLPTLEAKGFELVPASVVVRRRMPDVRMAQAAGKPVSVKLSVPEDRSADFSREEMQRTYEETLKAAKATAEMLNKITPASGAGQKSYFGPLALKAEQ